MSEQEFRKKIIQKLDTLIKLVAISTRLETILKEKKQKDQINTLSDLGLSREVIALMLGTTSETVRVTLAKMKSKAKSKSRKTQKNR